MRQPMITGKMLAYVLIFCLPGIFMLSSCASPRGDYRSDPSVVGHTESGKASYYAMKYQFRKTASGEVFNQMALTAAHRTLPFGTKVRVTNIKNNQSVTVRINDRGPFVRGRVIDLSRAAFSEIGNLNSGVIDVHLEGAK